MPYLSFISVQPVAIFPSSTTTKSPPVRAGYSFWRLWRQSLFLSPWPPLRRRALDLLAPLLKSPASMTITLILALSPSSPSVRYVDRHTGGVERERERAGKEILLFLWVGRCDLQRKWDYLLSNLGWKWWKGTFFLPSVANCLVVVEVMIPGKKEGKLII